MRPQTVTEALKEWAVVKRSLLEGHQIMLIRKGGLIEETGDFDLKAQTFAIMPTYIHETERGGDLQPCFLDWLRDEEGRRIRAPQNQVVIDAICEATDIVRVDDRERLIRLMPQHIWSRAFIDNRFDWDPYKPVFAVLVRAWALPAPVILPWTDDYGGCRSWATLQEPIPTAGAFAAIGDDAFARRRDLTLSLLRE